jgi:Transcriptional regulatory protein, C terminal
VDDRERLWQHKSARMEVAYCGCRYSTQSRLACGAEIDLGGPSQRWLFGLLAIAAGQPVGRAEPVSALWSGPVPAGAANVIQTYVKHLRRVLDPDRRPRSPDGPLTSIGSGYALQLAGDDELDVNRFRELVQRAAAAGQLGHALVLSPGAPFADVPSHPAVAELRRERRAGLAR